MNAIPKIKCSICNEEMCPKKVHRKRKCYCYICKEYFHEDCAAGLNKTQCPHCGLRECGRLVEFTEGILAGCSGMRKKTKYFYFDGYTPKKLRGEPVYNNPSFSHEDSDTYCLMGVFVHGAQFKKGIIETKTPTSAAEIYYTEALWDFRKFKKMSYVLTPEAIKSLEDVAGKGGSPEKYLEEYWDNVKKGCHYEYNKDYDLVDSVKAVAVHGIERVLELPSDKKDHCNIIVEKRIPYFKGIRDCGGHVFIFQNSCRLIDGNWKIENAIPLECKEVPWKKFSKP